MLSAIHARFHPFVSPQVEAYGFFRTVAPWIALANTTAAQALDYWLFPGAAPLSRTAWRTRVVAYSLQG
jgi:hypothetical protein